MDAERADGGNRVGEYLRARREQVRPEDAGIRVTSHRRVPGLRRDELAMLAGISTEYYTRLEQGRDRRPSRQVLDAVARALQLDVRATAHLHALAETSARRTRPTRRRTESVRPGLAAMIDGWAEPAYVEGRYLDILHANALARALFPVFTPGTNVLKAILLDGPGLDERWPEADVARIVGQLRASVGADADDERLQTLVGELSVRSRTFAELWARHDVTPPPGHGSVTFSHPQVGEIELEFEKLRVVGAEDQVVVVYRAEPATRAAESLALLRAMASAPTTRSEVGRADEGAGGSVAGSAAGPIAQGE